MGNSNDAYLIHACITYAGFANAMGCYLSSYIEAQLRCLGKLPYRWLSSLLLLLLLLLLLSSLLLPLLLYSGTARTGGRCAARNADTAAARRGVSSCPKSSVANNVLVSATRKLARRSPAAARVSWAPTAACASIDADMLAVRSGTLPPPGSPIAAAHGCCCYCWRAKDCISALKVLLTSRHS